MAGRTPETVRPLSKKGRGQVFFFVGLEGWGGRAGAGGTGSGGRGRGFKEEKTLVSPPYCRALYALYVGGLEVVDGRKGERLWLDAVAVDATVGGNSASYGDWT